MKNNLTTALLGIVLLATIQTATGQQPASAGNNEFRIRLVSGRLAFATIADFEKAVNQPTEKQRASFLQAVKSIRGFVSFTEKQNASPTLRKKPDSLKYLIPDDYFTAMLNPDLAIQIGEHILRVNPVTEKVYALPIANAAQYNDLVTENTNNKNMRVFSTEDNVLEILKGKAARLFCTESGIGSKHNGMYLNDFSRILATLDFNRYGFYYSVVATLYPVGSSGVVYTFDFTGGINKGLVYYKIKCGGTVGGYQISSYGSWTGTTRKYQSYQGSVNLNKLYFGCRITKLVNGVATPVTPYFNIRANY